MKLSMKTRREPMVGDVWTYEGAEHYQVYEVTPRHLGAEPVVTFRDGSSVAAGILHDDDGWRLSVTGALTLAEREQLGIMPDLSDDDRTPLEKMTAERDELLVLLDARMDGQAHAHEAAEAAVSIARSSLEQRDFARAFAASQGRVIRKLKAERDAARAVDRSEELWAEQEYAVELEDKLEAAERKLAEATAERDTLRAEVAGRHSAAVMVATTQEALLTEALEALCLAEAALADIGDAEREPGDDVAWCERRAAKALPQVRDTLGRHATWKREVAE